MKKKIGIIVVVVTLILSACLFLGIDYFYGVYSNVKVEAGRELTAKELTKRGNEKAYYVKGKSYDCTKPGVYTTLVKSGFFSYKCVIKVHDSIAPVAEAKDVSAVYGQAMEPSDFVQNVQDATEVEYQFLTQPDFFSLEDQSIDVEVKDAGGNTTVVTSRLQVSPVKEEMTIQAGTEFPDIQMFLVDQKFQAEFVSTEEVLLNAVGEYEVTLRVEGKEYVTRLLVEDSEAPDCEIQSVHSFLGAPVEPERFITACEDGSGTVVFSYETEPNFYRIGEQRVVVNVTDEGGNQSSYSSMLYIEDDKEAPQLHGVKDHTVFIGDAISYKDGVRITDNSNVEIPLEVKTEGVDLKTEGVYQVVYVATDYAGNSTEKEITLTVKQRVCNPEEVHAMADEVLSQIIKEGMTDYEKVDSIYYWIRRNVGYLETSSKEDVIEGAYDGLKRHQGDCFVYYSTAKELLTRAGIENRDIEKIPTKSTHYWNLVNIGDGWYHFDTTPRHSGGDFCMIPNDQMLEYSSHHAKSHNYDAEEYSDVEWGQEQYHDFDPYYRKPEVEEALPEGAQQGL